MIWGLNQPHNIRLNALIIMLVTSLVIVVGLHSLNRTGIGGFLHRAEKGMNAIPRILVSIKVVIIAEFAKEKIIMRLASNRKLRNKEEGG